MKRFASLFALVGALLVYGCHHDESGTSANNVAPPSPKKGGAGGGEARGPSRVAVKHATDADAAKIDKTAKDTTWAEIQAIKRPDDLGSNSAQTSRFGPFETSTWRIKGTLTSIVLRKDGDYYLTVKDGKGGEGVIEVPDPKNCAGSPLEKSIEDARKALEDKYHPTDQKQTTNDPATIEGVGFYGWRNQGTGGYGNSSRLMPGTGFHAGS